MRKHLNVPVAVALTCIVTISAPFAASSKSPANAKTATSVSSNTLTTQASTLSRRIEQIKNESDLNLAAVKAMQSKNYGEAERIYKQMLAMANQQGDLSKQSMALFQIGNVQSAQSRYKDAELTMKEALRIAKAEQNGPSINATMITSCLEAVLEKEAKYREAEPLMVSLREQYERTSPNDLSMAMVLERNATLLEHMGRADEAKAMKARAAAIMKDRAPTTSQSLSELKGIQSELKNDNASAEASFKAAMKQAEQNYGQNDLRYAEALSGLANLYNRQRRYKEAESAFQRVVAIQK